MAKFKTLDLHLTQLDVIRAGPGSYLHQIRVTDWDDGVEFPMSIQLEYPIIAISNFKIRIQVEDLIESEPEE